MPRLMATAAAIAAAPLVLGACAPRYVRHEERLPPAARARFEPPQGDVVFENAVRAATRAGYRIRSCDAERRRFETALVELEASCGGTTCLARQWVEVLLGYRVARVRVERELYDGAFRAWLPEHERQAIEAARELLARIVEDLPERSAAENPCAAARVEVSALDGATTAR